MSNQKIKIGSQVEVVNYGHLIWTIDPKEFEGIYPEIFIEKGVTKLHFFDIEPERVGMKGLVVGESSSGDWSIHFEEIDNTISWFSNNQLKLVE